MMQATGRIMLGALAVAVCLGAVALAPSAQAAACTNLMVPQELSTRGVVGIRSANEKEAHPCAPGTVVVYVLASGELIYQTVTASQVGPSTSKVSGSIPVPRPHDLDSPGLPPPRVAAAERATIESWKVALASPSAQPTVNITLGLWGAAFFQPKGCPKQTAANDTVFVNIDYKQQRLKVPPGWPGVLNYKGPSDACIPLGVGRINFVDGRTWTGEVRPFLEPRWDFRLAAPVGLGEMTYTDGHSEIAVMRVERGFSPNIGMDAISAGGSDWLEELMTYRMVIDRIIATKAPGGEYVAPDPLVEAARVAKQRAEAAQQRAQFVAANAAKAQANAAFWSDLGQIAQVGVMASRQAIDQMAADDANNAALVARQNAQMAAAQEAARQQQLTSAARAAAPPERLSSSDPAIQRDYDKGASFVPPSDEGDQIQQRQQQLAAQAQLRAAQAAEQRRQQEAQAKAQEDQMRYELMADNSYGDYSSAGLSNYDMKGTRSPGSGSLTRNLSHIGGCRATSFTAEWSLSNNMGGGQVSGNWRWTGEAGCTPPAFTTLWIEVSLGGAHGWVATTPTVPMAGASSFNVQGIPDWNRMFCGFNGARTTSCLSADDAKRLWLNGSVTDVALGW